MWFAAWAFVCALLCFGLLAILTIGTFFVIPVPLTALMLLGRRPDARASAAGLLSGLSLPLFYVAILNRSGPCRLP